MTTGVSKLILPDMPLGEFFGQAAAAGCDTVELCLDKTGEFTLDSLETAAPYILELSRKYDLPVVSLVHRQCSGNLLASGASGEKSIGETIGGLRAAKRIGAKCTLHTLGRLEPDICYDEAYENAVSALKEIAKAAAGIGVVLAVEFVWNGFLFSPIEMKRLLDEVGSRYVGFYFDPGNMAVFQYPHHWARILGNHIKMVHMKDWKGKPFNGTWPALLKGEVDFLSVMRELRRAGYDGPLISEVDVTEASLGETDASIRKIIAMA